jgi:hypothetical protein
LNVNKNAGQRSASACLYIGHKDALTGVEIQAVRIGAHADHGICGRRASEANRTRDRATLTERELGREGRKRNKNELQYP